jgi:hypothetical protein
MDIKHQHLQTTQVHPKFVTICLWHTFAISIPHAQFEANSMLGRRRLLPKPLLNAGESPPPTLQSTVLPAGNYAPQLLGKVAPIFSPIVNAARK